MLIGLILEIPYYVFPNLEEKNRKELFNQETKEEYYYKNYNNLLVISFNLLILTPIIIILIFNSNGVFNLSFNIISTIDSDLIIAASVLLVAVQFSEQNYLEKAKMFPKEYPELLLSNNNYLKNAIFTIIFAILSLEILSQNINIVFQNAHINVAINIAIGVMLLALYFVFSAFLDILYIEKIRQLNKKLYNN